MLVKNTVKRVRQTENTQSHKRKGATRAFRNAVCGCVLLTSTAMNRAELVPAADLNGVYEYIISSEYDVRWFDEVSAFKSANRAQNLRFTYFGDGFAVGPRIYAEDTGKPWEVEIKLVGFGRDAGQQGSAAGAHVAAEGHRARSANQNIEIDFQNEKEGMRENFTVFERPPGNQPLELTLSVQSGPLHLSATTDSNGVEFRDADNNLVLRYSDLHVFDSTGAALPAAIAVRSPAQIAIVVDDSEAAYPVLIDPLTYGQVVYNGQSGAKFGFSHCEYTWSASNPLDNPGIAVGAPYYDNGMTGDAGAVFAYYNFVTFPTSPTWTKLGDQANGHFGWSVATAGDVDGNNYLDLLVGSPDYDSNGYVDNGKAETFFAGSTGLSSSSSWSISTSQGYAHTGRLLFTKAAAV